ncbi:MAG TPA: hypothetical protein VHR47_12655 [Bacillota bacterium]|nr:hypothetical protein [Bacillota bacterium]
MIEVLPKKGEGDPNGDWQKEFADQLNPDAVLVAKILEATPRMDEAEPEEVVENPPIQ